MHNEVLTSPQVKLLPILKQFNSEFGMVGGTAIALHIGHRESIDFDLFSPNEFDNKKILRKLEKTNQSIQIGFEDEGQLNLKIDEVKFTFFHFPYPIVYSQAIDDYIKIPDLLSLAAMKVFALGQRAKWKDYVDLYFILRDCNKLADINERAKELFGTEYNEKLIRMQLAYFKDINYTEPIIYRPGYEVSDQTVKDALAEYSLS